MKVILLKDIRKVGKKYEVKDVSDGYALNFLIPQKSVEVANPSNLSRINTLKAKDEANKKIQEDLLIKNLKSLDGKTVEIKAQANEKGHLFKGMHKEELIAALKSETQVDITPDYIVLDKPLKEVGEHKIEVKVQDKSATFTANIVAA